MPIYYPHTKQPGAPNVGTFDGADLSAVFADANALHAAIEAGDFSKIRIGDYWPISLTGTYRDVGTYTCPAGTQLYTDAALTAAAGTASADLDAQWMDATYCVVSSGGTKYCATGGCLAYRERTLANAVMNMEVTAINPYWGYGDSGELLYGKNHVLLISRDCLPTTLRFRKADNVWHIAPDPAGGVGVWQGSALYATLNDPGHGVLPLVAATGIGAYIYKGGSDEGMRYYGETRATETAASSGGAWLSRGQLFLPTEDEVWGREIFTFRAHHGQLQLPIFAASRRHISKRTGNGSSQAAWWSMSAYDGNSLHICNVQFNGLPYYNKSIYNLGVPICFLAV